MAVTNDEKAAKARDAALQGALTQIERQFGKGSVMRMGDEGAQVKVAAIPTGALSLDLALGIGQVPACELHVDGLAQAVEQCARFAAPALPLDPCDLQVANHLQVLLTLLAEEEGYGYAVVVRLHELGFAGLAEGTVYPALTRLERQGFLAARLERSSSGPARKYYRTTPAGRAELAALTREWTTFSKAMTKLLQKERKVR